MTKSDRQTDNEKVGDADMHSASFVALVDLVRHMARCAAQNDYDSMLKAAEENRQLFSEWKRKQ